MWCLVRDCGPRIARAGPGRDHARGTLASTTGVTPHVETEEHDSRTITHLDSTAARQQVLLPATLLAAQ